MGDKERAAPKKRKVEQNHQVNVTSIAANMDHFVNIVISPDRLHPDGAIKRGIRINLDEFSRGCRVLGERCGYRLLTPLSSFAYAAYLHQACEDFLKNGAGDGPSRPIIQVYNNSPFRFQAKSYVAVCSVHGQRVFELLPEEGQGEGFAKEVEDQDLPFCVNWTGPKILDMEINDKQCQTALIKIVEGLDELKPNTTGLGVCVLAEFGRFLLYNAVVDGEDCAQENLDNGEENDPDDAGFHGHKQMLLVLQSNEVETGKSFISELLVRIFHGKKTGIFSTISFDSAKVLLGRGEPVVIDDFNNDDLGSVLISRGSKAIWGKSQITLRGQSITPKSNLALCTNENITDLRVEGKNKMEIFRKLSVIDLGEETMSKSNTANKGEVFKDIIEQTRVVRKHLPSFLGMMFQVCGDYITPEQFQVYDTVTKHERLANILKNCANLHDKLNKFCESEFIEKPNSLASDLDTSCLTNKSELVHKFKSPDEIVKVLVSQKSKIVTTEHEGQEGIAFDVKDLDKYPWCIKSLSAKKDGVKVYPRMRTRQLTSARETKAAFLGFDFMREASLKLIRDYLKNTELLELLEESEETEETVETVLSPKELIAQAFELDCMHYQKLKKERFLMAEKYITSLADKVSVNTAKSGGFICSSCNFVARSKGGLTRHTNNKKCKPK